MFRLSSSSSVIASFRDVKKFGAVVFSAVLLPGLGFSRDLYVSNSGSDSAAGTSAAPLRTIQKAVDKAVGGDNVMVTSGVYRERINFPRSGSDGKFITVRSASGTRAIVDAASVSGDHIFYMWGKSYIRIQGLEIRNNLKVNDGSMIRVEGFGRNIQILDNLMYNTSGEHAMGITFYGSHSSPLSNAVVSGNELYNINPGWSETVTFNGNVDGFEVENNYIHDVENIGIDFIGGEGMCPTASRDKARNGVCRYNTVQKARSGYEGGYAAGIYVDGGENILIEKNEVSECDLGIEVGAENPGTVVSRVRVRKNVIFDNDKAGLIFGGYEQSRGRVVNCEFSSNTLYKNDTKKTGMGEICVQWASNNSIVNNIVVAGSHNVFIYSEEGNVANRSNGNVFFSDAGANRAQFTWAGKWAGSLAKHQAQSGQDGESVFKNPSFINARRGDFRMKSPRAIRAGATGKIGAKARR